MRILLLHDLFRAALFGQGGQNHTTRMWESVLAPVLAGLGHTLLRPAAFLDDHPPVLAEWAARHRLPPERASWVRLYADPAARPLVAELLARAVLAPIGGADLVLGWELSPNMLRALHARGQPCIEFNLDAIRFAPDLLLRARSNSPVLAARLAAHGVPDAILRGHANRLAAAIAPALRALPPSLPPSSLFVGQVSDDSSLIREAALVRVADHLPALRAAAPPDAVWLLKPHPYGAPHPDIRTLHAQLPGARIVPDNIYALLNAPHVRRIVTMSSSVAAEAAFFGKPATSLLIPDQAPARLPEFGPYHRLDSRLLTPAFWHALLDGGPPARALSPVPIARLFAITWGRDPAPRIDPRPLGPGEEHDFGEGGSGLSLCGFGWQPAKPDRSWCAGDFATVLFTPAAARSGLRLRLHCVPGTSRALSVAIGLRAPHLVGERTLATDLLDPARPAPIDVLLPSTVCGGPVELVLRLGAAPPARCDQRLALLRLSTPCG